MRQYHVVVVVLGFVAGCACSSRVTPARRTDEDVSRFVRAERRKSVLVFVHGIFGDAKDTWTCPAGAYWPTMLTADDAFRPFDVYVARYDTPYFGNTMTIDEIAANLKNRFDSDGILTNYDGIVFVAHSLGGLVVQRFLLTYREYAPKVRFIYFFSTPETGAQIASLGAHFSADPLLRQMIPGDRNDYLLNLEAEWRAAQFGSIHRYCAYEKKALHTFLVVDRLSGTRNCETAVPINEDHAGIVKPCSKTSDAYVALRNAITTIAPTPDKTTTNTPQGSPVPSTLTIGAMTIAKSVQGRTVTYHINRPEVKAAMTPIIAIRFQPGDQVRIQAGGCVQTGGSGRTWKRYVDPIGANTDRFYHGLIGLPGLQVARIQQLLGSTITIPPLSEESRTFLRIGYEDDEYTDNGYYARDDGAGDQCRGLPDAYIDITMTR